MELKRAKEVLEASGAVIITESHIIFDLYRDAVSVYLLRDGKYRITGHYTTEEHEAIATWMRDPEGVVRA